MSAPDAPTRAPGTPLGPVESRVGVSAWLLLGALAGLVLVAYFLWALIARAVP